MTPALHILELTTNSPDGLPRLPGIALQTIAIGAVSATSAPFNEASKAIRIQAAADCAIVVGNGELSAAEGDIPISAGQSASFSVTPGDRISVIGRAMQNSSNDPFALFSIIADPEACKKRMLDLKTETDELRKLQTEVSASQSALAQQQAAAEKELADVRTKRDTELAAARQDFETERSRTANALAAREARVVEMETALKAETDTVAALKADLRRRLDLLHQASQAGAA
jgi:hypothetical protein